MEHRHMGRFPRTPTALPGSRLAAAAAVGQTEGAPRASAGGGARGCRGRPPPLPGPEPVHPKAPAPNRPKFTPAAPGAFPDTSCRAQWESARGPGEDSTPRTSSSKTSPGKGRCKDSWGGLGQPLPRTADSPQSNPKRPRGHLQPSPETAPFATVSPRDTRSRAVNTFQEKLRTPHGAALPSVRRPRGAHTHPSSALGRSPSRSPILRTKMSGRVTGQPPPGPTPGAGRTRCWCPGAAPRPGRGGERWTPGGAGRRGRRSTRDSPSARPPRRGGKGREGEDTIWQSTAAAPGSFQQPPPGRRRHEQAAAAAAAVPAAAVPHPPPPLPLASSLSPRPSPRCHGNVAPRRLAPPLPPFPPPRASREEC
ncbi:hypothetical protein QTO34_006623 [Cnephaeus nilssonii]|uniref:Uncharacterized protein n=1 Tax=Cnephaeus nilssonii TaxID=3371016 RepID=A0AA40LIN3_CNENI|nr:hypothetical protein QTO34_006623 [Eptesicus nilssonii]